MTRKEHTIFENFKIVNFIELSAAALFTLLSISFHGDISLLAFPLSLIYTGILAYIFFVKILKNTNGKFYTPVVKLTSYLPYALLVSFIIRRAGATGTAYWYDLISVLLWSVVFVCSIIITNMMKEKKAKALTENWSILPSFKKPKGFGRVIWEVFDWIDAIVWALFTVMLVQIFIFQLYTIPSESMVPTFLIKDRAAVSKIDCGPKFPLTDIGLPDMRKYKKGDTIVLRNPHYTIDRKSEVKSVTSQLIYMLTLMQVNINRDENGEPKADPLVKRICGVPGEQLVMQDGTLYTRTKDDPEWKPAEMDRKYACWDLSKIKSSLQESVQTYPLSAVQPAYNQMKQRTNSKAVIDSSGEQYELMLQFEEKRRNFDLDAAAFQANQLVMEMGKLVYKTNLDQKFNAPATMIYDLLNTNNVQDVTRRIMTQDGGYEWFKNFMTSWIPAKNYERDMYAESNYKLDVMAKISFGNMVVRYADLMRKSISASLWNSDSVLVENMMLAQNVTWYVQLILDSRNMCVFPANDSTGKPNYLPKDCYFMMGDNRFNSLDLRHASGYSPKNLTEEDSMPIMYQSILEPQYVSKKYIIGKPVIRYWPVNRFARIR